MHIFIKVHNHRLGYFELYKDLWY